MHAFSSVEGRVDTDRLLEAIRRTCGDVASWQELLAAHPALPRDHLDLRRATDGEENGSLRKEKDPLLTRAALQQGASRHELGGALHKGRKSDRKAKVG